MNATEPPRPRRVYRGYRQVIDLLQPCSVTAETLRDWIRRGEFPAPFRLGPRTLFWDADAVDAFIARKAQEATSAATC